MYKRLINSKLYEYLKLKGWLLKKSGKLIMGICPSCNKKPFTASIIPNVNVFHCIPCNKDFDIMDFVKIIEPEFSTKSDEDIYTHLKEILDIKIQTQNDTDKNAKLFEMYQKNGFSLVPVIANGKRVIELDWTNKEHKDPQEWKEWINKRLNVGVRTGEVSNLTIIDVDQKIIPEEIKTKMGKTLMQLTKNGVHLFYKYEKDLPKTRIKSLLTDVETSGGQCVIAPSIVEDYPRNFVGEEIITMPVELKEFLIKKMDEQRNVQPKQIDSCEEIITPTEQDLVNFGIVPQGEGRSEYLMKMTGIVRQQFDERDTRKFIQLLNKTHCVPPIPDVGLEATVLKSLGSYANTDMYFLKKKILEFLQIAERARTDEIEMYAFHNRVKGEDKKRLSRVLVELIKEDKIYRRKNEYFLIKYANWQTSLINATKPLPFKVPYINHLANFRWGEHVLIGGEPGSGKTHLAMNIIKGFVSQGIKPKLFESESNKNFIDIGLQLGLKESDFEYEAKVPWYQVNFDSDCVIIIDWINPVNYAETDKLFQKINNQLLRSNCFLISLMQLKKSFEKGKENGWFAPNLVDQYPSFAMRFLLIDKKTDREHGHFIIDKVNKPKYPRIWNMPTIFNNQTGELKLIEDLEKETK